MDRPPLARFSWSRIPWRSRLFWQRLGYTLTAIWMIAVLSITKEDVHAPLFSYIFIVPLAGWIVGLAIGKVLSRFWPQLLKDPAPRNPPRP